MNEKYFSNITSTVIRLRMDERKEEKKEFLFRRTR
jgi:hypothetical protein